MAMPEKQLVYILFYTYPGAICKNYMGVFDGEDKARYYMDVCIREGMGRKEDFSIQADHVKTQLSVY